MNKSAKIIVLVTVAFICTVLISIPIISYNFAYTASGDGEGYEVIKYQGKTYYCFSAYTSEYEFERDRLVGGNIFESIYTIKNDESHEFLLFDGLQLNLLYTSNRNYNKNTINKHFLKNKNISISSDMSE